MQQMNPQHYMYISNLFLCQFPIDIFLGFQLN